MERALVLPVTPLARGFVDRISEDDVERVRALDLDVLLRFGFRIIRGGILSAARHGVWSYHHGDSEQYRGGPAHLWELIERNPVSGVVLQQLTEQLDAGRVIAGGLFATTPSLSVAENRFGPYWSSQHFVIRALHELHQSGTVGALPQKTSQARYVGLRPIYRRPTNLEITRWFGTEALKRSVGYVARRARHVGTSSRDSPHWRIALRPVTTPLYADRSPGALRSFRWLPKPEARFCADPFLLDHRSDTWLFYEDYDEAAARGAIACARLTNEGQLEGATIVLSRPYHLSYPHVFECEGEIFMVPESHEAGTVDLYRAHRFPDVWKHETTLLNLRAVDASVFQEDDCWWMLATPRVVAGHGALTYVWRSESLFGPWKLSSHTPVNCDVRTARGAGRVFRDGADLWRPSQDCSVSYGRALGFSRIIQLRDVPREEQVCKFEPRGRRQLSGIHTYNRSERWEAIDGYFNGR